MDNFLGFNLSCILKWFSNAPPPPLFILLFSRIYADSTYLSQMGVRSIAFLYFSLKKSMYFGNLSSFVCYFLTEFKMFLLIRVRV